MRPELRRLSALALAIGGLLAVPAQALEWSTTQVAATVKPLQSSIEVSFLYRNASAQPVKFLSIETNCDCLAARSTQNVIAPGESGVVVATFTVGDRLGLYERAITVRTDDSPTPQRLVARMEVLEPASVKPLNLVWALGSTPSAKSVELRPADGTGLEFAEVFATDAAFQVTLETVEPRKLYRIHVTPTATTRPLNAAIRAKGRASDGREIIVSAYANVR